MEELFEKWNMSSFLPAFRGKYCIKSIDFSLKLKFMCNKKIKNVSMHWLIIFYIAIDAHGKKFYVNSLKKGYTSNM